jgi:hypothetical protein
MNQTKTRHTSKVSHQQNSTMYHSPKMERKEKAKQRKLEQIQYLQKHGEDIEKRNKSVKSEFWNKRKIRNEEF